MKRFYLTTTLPYVNAAPHIGFALEIVQADVLVRSKRAQGYEVVFNTGTDEHGQKIYEKAAAEGKDPQAYVDEYAAKFDRLKEALDLSYTHFVRTTDPHHVGAAQEFWRRCAASGDIYKKAYKVKYCVGCELEKTDSELVDGKCPIHPNLELQTIDEENYFFRFSKYQQPLLDLYAAHPDFVMPDYRLTEIRNFVAAGLADFSISRLKEKMPWGVPVPGDDDHVMYVWFDALVNYISTIGWPEDGDSFAAFWGTKDAPNAVQVAGKDNLRQQSAMWQAMLLSAGLPNSRQILIHGFVTSGGEKMSKSLGNVVDPFEIVGKYGTDALRYWLLRELPPFEDGDFTWEKFAARYEADLVNGLGNFAARVQAMGEKMGAIPLDSAAVGPDAEAAITRARSEVTAAADAYKWHEALAAISRLLSFGDDYVNKNKPWETKDPKAIYDLIAILDNAAAMLLPYLPKTSAAITASISNKDGAVSITKTGILFPRK
jgi:methionyl-tRNA synthetase